MDGSGGSDSLFGGAGNDRLVGGSGVDEFTGGDGADVFAFSPGDLSSFLGLPIFERIHDFNQGFNGTYNDAEGDWIDISAIVGAALLNGELGSVDVHFNRMTVAARATNAP